MAFEHRPGSFSLFRNEKKEKEAQPDYRGDGMLPDGQLASIAAWLKETSTGKKFFSIKVEPKTDADTLPRQAPADDFDEPF